MSLSEPLALMEPPASARAYNDPSQKRSWQPTDRPTVNTLLSSSNNPPALPTPTPLPSSSLSTPSSSYPSSPWNQSVGAGQSLPFPYYNDGSQASSHPSQTAQPNTQLASSIDWGAVLASPLDPATFAVLDAGGALAPPPAKHAYGTSFNTSLPFVAYPLPSPAVQGMTPLPPSAVSSSGLRDSWPANTTTPPYSPSFLSSSRRTSPSQSPQSASSLSHAKGKAAAVGGVSGPGVGAASAPSAMHPYASARSRLSEPVVGSGSGAHLSGPGERQPQPEPRGFINLHQVVNRPSLANRRSSAQHVHQSHHNLHHPLHPSQQGSANDGFLPMEMRSGMPPPTFPPHLGANRPSITYPSSGERAHINLPPSLWMSPVNPNPVSAAAMPSVAGAAGAGASATNAAMTSMQTTNTTAATTTHPALPQLTMPTGPSIVSSRDTAPSSASSSRLSSSPFVCGTASTIPTSATTEVRSPSIYSDFLSSDPFSNKLMGPLDLGTLEFPSPPPSTSKGSPDLSSIGLDGEELDPERAEKDPLLAQMWKLYARTKAVLPHKQRMENLTWRMMTLALKKSREDEARAAAQNAQGQGQGQSQRQREGTVTAEQNVNVKEQAVSPPLPSSATSGVAASSSAALAAASQVKAEPETRGRRPDKTMARVRVVGFEGKNQDGEDEEYVIFIIKEKKQIINENN